MQITKNTVATLDYTLSREDGKVLDSSENHGPMVYLHGAGAILPGLEVALEGKRVGDTLKVQLPPEQAYGAHDPKRVIAVPKKDFVGVDNIAVGMQFRAGDQTGARIVTVTAIEGETVMVDANHPLAGTTVSVEAKVLEIRPATEEEIAHSHVCYGEGNCEHHGDCNGSCE